MNYEEQKDITCIELNNLLKMIPFKYKNTRSKIFDLMDLLCNCCSSSQISKEDFFIPSEEINEEKIKNNSSQRSLEKQNCVTSANSRKGYDSNLLPETLTHKRLTKRQEKKT